MRLEEGHPPLGAWLARLLCSPLDLTGHDGSESAVIFIALLETGF